MGYLGEEVFFSCAYWNREEANFCENCGVNLPVKESVPLHIQTQAGVKKWKTITAVSIVIVIILTSGFFNLYSKYNQLSYDYDWLNYQHIVLQDEYNKLDGSFKLVLALYPFINRFFNSYRN